MKKIVTTCAVLLLLVGGTARPAVFRTSNTIAPSYRIAVLIGRASSFLFV